MRLPDKNSLIQFVKFGIVGASNTVISLGIYYCFIAFRPDWYQLGNVAGWVISVANAFFWNHRYVFRSEGGEKPLWKQIAKTYCSYGGTFLLNTALLFLDVEIWRWPPTVGPIVNLFVTIPLNFLLNKFWAFR